ncbi:transporter substrate-binding domain-containing protein [Neisseriaceae bacterium TC5R-5]|nr:transporter substrate-binding domain-containing protein [Neisseriaceae bacterium TC5R-5]
MNVKHGCWAMCLGWLASAQFGWAQQNEVTLHFNERPPYLQVTANGASGLTATPAANAFRHANIPFHWQKTPSERQLYLLQHNEGLDCAVGWYKTPAREKFAQFTSPIYRDRAYVAVVRQQSSLQEGMSLEAALASGQRLLMKQGYSYGPTVDAKIAKQAPKVVATTSENRDMLQMLAAGDRADWLIISDEELGYFLKSKVVPENTVRRVALTGMPAGLPRYILCSQKVPRTVIEALNKSMPPLAD